MSHGITSVLNRPTRRGLLAHTAILVLVGTLSTLAHSRGSGAGFSMAWHTIDGGGGIAVAGATSLAGTFGQPDAAQSLKGGDYEFFGGFWHTAGGRSCPADIDGDGTVSASDLAIVLGAWSTTFSVADLDSSGQVDASDLAVLLGAWGPCP